MSTTSAAPRRLHKAEVDKVIGSFIEIYRKIPAVLLPSRCHNICLEIAQSMLNTGNDASEILKEVGVHIAFGFPLRNGNPVFDEDLVRGYVAKMDLNVISPLPGPFHAWIRVSQIEIDPTLVPSLQKYYQQVVTKEYLISKDKKGAKFNGSRITFEELRSILVT